MNDPCIAYPVLATPENMALAFLSGIVLVLFFNVVVYVSSLIDIVFGWRSE